MKPLIDVIIPMILAMYITLLLDTMLYESNHEDNHDTHHLIYMMYRFNGYAKILQLIRKNGLSFLCIEIHSNMPLTDQVQSQRC